jgi:dipeptide/tripeptide permease
LKLGTKPKIPIPPFATSFLAAKVQPPAPAKFTLSCGTVSISFALSFHSRITFAAEFDITALTSVITLPPHALRSVRSITAYQLSIAF